MIFLQSDLVAAAALYPWRRVQTHDSGLSHCIHRGGRDGLRNSGGPVVSFHHFLSQSILRTSYICVCVRACARRENRSDTQQLQRHPLQPCNSSQLTLVLKRRSKSQPHYATRKSTVLWVKICQVETNFFFKFIYFPLGARSQIYPRVVSSFQPRFPPLAPTPPVPESILQTCCIDHQRLVVIAGPHPCNHTGNSRS